MRCNSVSLISRKLGLWSSYAVTCPWILSSYIVSNIILNIQCDSVFHIRLCRTTLRFHVSSCFPLGLLGERDAMHIKLSTIHPVCTFVLYNPAQSRMAIFKYPTICNTDFLLSSALSRVQQIFHFNRWKLLYPFSEPSHEDILWCDELRCSNDITICCSRVVGKGSEYALRMLDKSRFLLRLHPLGVKCNICTVRRLEDFLCTAFVSATLSEPHNLTPTQYT